MRVGRLARIGVKVKLFLLEEHFTGDALTYFGTTMSCHSNGVESNMYLWWAFPTLDGRKSPTGFLIDKEKNLYEFFKCKVLIFAGIFYDERPCHLQ